MTYRPAYTQHPAYAEWERLSKAGDLARAAAKLCEAMRVRPSRQIETVADLFDSCVANRWPVADDSTVQHRVPDAIDPGSPFYRPQSRGES